ncbi:hypothetical protein HON52_00510 [Candidatus Uhrbacteria bacterium]|jgi:hypothetical protein|nr:hypothetical protein [Candidatus Uhrbacteria bacterium]
MEHSKSFQRSLVWGTLLALLVLSSFFVFTLNAQAAAYETMQVSLSGSGGELIMEPGEVKEVSVEFLNAGSSTWMNDGAGYLSVYTYGPKYRRSVFDPATWLGPDQVKRISETVVAPGDTANVVFELHAPLEEGEYEETFALASEGVAWVDGGEFTFTITVSSEKVEAMPESIVDDEVVGDVYDGEVIVRTANKIKALAERPILFTVVVKNTGSTTWKNYGIQSQDVAIASSSSVDFGHPSWLGSQIAYAVETVAPGESATVSFAFSAPEVNGSHTARFDFVANGEVVDDALIEIPVEVTGGAASAINEPADEDLVDDDGIVESHIQQEEPLLRVGLLTVDDETDNIITITSYESDFDVRDTEGNLLAELEAGQLATGYYKDGYYYYDVGRGLEKSSYGLRFEPLEENAVMTITNFDYRLTRGGGYAYNTYRNVLEIRYNDYKDRTWVINEISIEMYLRGLAETSNISHEEYQKALLTAARTYAYYHFTRGTKRGNEYMHIVAYADDQVYRGYERETMAPRITEAVNDTRGTVVTYDDDIAITPYFSRSDGYTRDWAEVWGGDVAWAKSVKVPCDEGKSLWGHGVGMSASGALCMANGGDTWDEILKHFYTGVELHKRWE